MCGIAGFIAHNLSEPEHVARAMANALAHRGPDDAGTWIDKNAGVGMSHRRLSIVDLSAAGHQPMLSPSGRYVAVLNGEIYNHAELRSSLASQVSQQIAWRGHSDTETLLAAIEAWGIDAAIKKTVGMFAIAIWDRQTHCLTLIRDRLGEKPLYYGWLGSAFLFASELKALGVFPGFTAECDPNSVAAYFRYGYVPSPMSIFRGIQKLGPGSLLQISVQPGGFASRETPSRTYWSLADTVWAGQTHRFQGTYDDAVAELDSLLRNAVRLQMVADVPVGAFLSGGVDSSTIVALMQELGTNPARTFTVGFHDKRHDESAYARGVAQHLGTDHTEILVSAKDAMECIPMLPVIYDEPFADSSQIPTYLVSKLARQHVTVSLSGDAGDELFGGYNHYFLAYRIWKALGWLPVAARTLIANRMLRASNRSWAIVSKLGGGFGSEQHSPLGHKMKSLAAVMTENDPVSMYQAITAHWFPQTPVATPATPPNIPSTPSDILEARHRMMFIDTVTYLPDDILAKIDRASMSVGLEARVPLLDHRVVEFAWQLPLAMKIAGTRGKRVLRSLLSRYVPDALIERPKKGFSLPIGQWLRGPLREWAEDLLHERRIAAQGLLDPVPIREAWREHLAGHRNWDRKLWTALMFQAWMDLQAPGKRSHH